MSLRTVGAIEEKIFWFERIGVAQDRHIPVFAEHSALRCGQRQSSDIYSNGEAILTARTVMLIERVPAAPKSSTDQRFVEQREERWGKEEMRDPFSAGEIGALIPIPI